MGTFADLRVVYRAITGFIAGLMLLGMSWSYLVQALQFSQPVDITLDQLIVQHPTSGWYRVTDGVLPAAFGVESYPTRFGMRSGLATAYMPLLHHGDLSPDDLAVPGSTFRVVVQVASMQALNPVYNCGRLMNSGRGIIAGARRSEQLTPEERQSILIDGPVVGMVARPAYELTRPAGIFSHMRYFGDISDPLIFLQEGVSPQPAFVVSGLLGVFLVVASPLLLVVYYVRRTANGGHSDFGSYGLALATLLARQQSPAVPQSPRTVTAAELEPADVMPFEARPPNADGR